MSLHQRLIHLASFWLLFAASLSLLGQVQADDELRKVQREFNRQIKPLLETHCYDCHSGDSADAGLDLSGFKTIKDLLNARKSWTKIRVRVAAKEMPPKDFSELSDDEHQKVIDWIDHLLNSVDCTQTNPGRVTIRRLNRTEYRNTIRDLLGVDYKPAEDFPGDDVGYGFDNIADVLSLPPILMEKYLQAAEKITETAIVDPAVPAFSTTVDGAEFKKAKSGSSAIKRHHILSMNGTISKQVAVPYPGKYEVRVRAYGNQAGNEPCEFQLVVDGKDVAKGQAAASDPYQADEITRQVRLKAGTRKIGIRFSNDFFDKSLPDGKQDRNLVVMDMTISGPINRLPKSHRNIIGKVPDSIEQQRVQARKILNRFTSRAYRRRVTSSELDRLMQFYDVSRDDGLGYEIGIRNTMQAVLISPYFLYRWEAPTEVGKTRFLKDFELATNLAFFLWGTMPDNELLAIANDDGLKDYKVYRAQIQRMLKHEKAESLVENFVAQWLQLRHLETFKPDPDLFPGIDQQMRLDMAQETKLVFKELIQRDASIFELLKTDFTYLNERLAKHYGIDGIRGEGFLRVPAKRTGRSGLMSHASILTLTSNPTRTSPVKRGKWIMENLLGEEPPPPDPEAMQLEDQQELKGTLRQRMEQHRKNPNCAVCHRVMDELGFALENYDAVGRWREREDSNLIDAHGELPDGTRFEGAVELQTTIGEKMKTQFARCLVEKMLIYALGRGLEYYDECAIDQIMERLEKNDYRFSQLIIGVVTSEPFLKRSGIEE